MEEFIREQIKDKPLNKKKVATKFLISAVSGLIFALVACGVMAIVFPRIIKTGQAVEGETESQVVDAGELVTEVDTEPEEKVEEKKVVEVKELTLADYQRIQNELYTIGNAANKSIVTITTVSSVKDWFNNSYETEGQGSGVIISDDKDELLILTEKKTIGKSKKLKVTFINDAVADATLKSYDGATGIAVLSVSKEQLDNTTLGYVDVAKFGNSNSVSKGMIAIALGSPLGTNYSILTGNITSTVNEISSTDNNYSVFTTDIVASENGSGILINVNGEVIGVVMQEYSTSDSVNTLTAVAISDVIPMIDKLVSGENVPYLGMYVTTVTEKIAEENQLPKGVYIKEVAMDSPAMLAGLQSGDVITEINGVEISTVQAYNKQVMSLEIGSECTVKVQRQGGKGYSNVTCKAEVGVLE